MNTIYSLNCILQVVQLILDGVLLCPPSECPQVICEIMAGCWKTNSKHRHKFAEISDTFRRALNKVRFLGIFQIINNFRYLCTLHSSFPFEIGRLCYYFGTRTSTTK